MNEQQLIKDLSELIKAHGLTAMVCVFADPEAVGYAILASSDVVQMAPYVVDDSTKRAIDSIMRTLSSDEAVERMLNGTSVDREHERN